MGLAVRIELANMVAV